MFNKTALFKRCYLKSCSLNSLNVNVSKTVFIYRLVLFSRCQSTRQAPVNWSSCFLSGAVDKNRSGVRLALEWAERRERAHLLATCHLHLGSSLQAEHQTHHPRTCDMVLVRYFEFKYVLMIYQVQLFVFFFYYYFLISCSFRMASYFPS